MPYVFRINGISWLLFDKCKPLRQQSGHVTGDFMFSSPPRGSYPSPRHSSTGYYITEVEYISTSDKVYTTLRRSCHPKATEADARKRQIPPGCFLENWDPKEEPIMLLGSVFDANSLGRWIYKWTCYYHGSTVPISDIAGELWLLLIRFVSNVKRAEECMPRIKSEDNREMVKDFMKAGDRLTDKFKKILKACETPMIKAEKRHEKEPARLGKNAGTAFIDMIFGRNGEFENIEKFRASIRLWNLRFDANCQEILRRPHV